MAAFYVSKQIVFMFALVITIRAIKLSLLATFNAYVAFKVFSVAIPTATHFTAVNNDVRFCPRL
jgi:hypothetical protein